MTPAGLDVFQITDVSLRKYITFHYYTDGIYVNKLPPCSQVQLEELTVAQLSSNLLPIMKIELHYTFRKRSQIRHNCARQIRVIFS